MDQREVVLYTSNRSLRSWRAKRLLKRRGIYVKMIDTTNDELRQLLRAFPQSTTTIGQRVPYLFVDHRPVGGFGDIKALDHSGMLKRLVRGAL